MIGDIAAYANSQGSRACETHIQPAQIAGIVDLVADGTISGKIAKDLLQIIIAEEPEGDPAEIVETRGMKQVTDLGAIEKVVDEIIAANPDQVAQGAGEADADRLVRRPGDEGLGRQGQPAGAERDPARRSWGIE